MTTKKRFIKREPEIIVFAGPNGAGKSTVASKYRQVHNLNTPFINADNIEVEYASDIERTIAEQRPQIEAVIKEYFPDIDVQSIPLRDMKSMVAAEFATQMRKSKLAKRESFMFETILLPPEKTHPLLKQAKQEGVIIKPVIVLTRNPDINVARNAQRAHEGGHDVPESRIRERYTDFMSTYLPQLIRLGDSFLIYDNSVKPTIIAKGHGKNFHVSGKAQDEWLSNIVETLTSNGCNIKFVNGIDDKLSDSFAGGQGTAWEK